MTHSQLSIRAAVSLALAASFVPAWGGDLAGRVTEGETNQPLPNAIVRIPALGRSVVADRSGEYRIRDVTGGSHTVEVEYVGLGATSSSVTVPASGQAEQDFTLNLGQGDVQELVVTGYRLAQITALQDKRSALVIKDSITADDAGKLPDRNAADALSRVIGLSVTTDQGEGRYVTIRGIDAALNNVTIDGQIIGSPEGDTRRVALDTVPADILSKLEVIKSVTPDMDGNAIGGSINLVTPGVFDDPDGRFFSATADVGFYDLGEQNPFGGSVAWGRTFGERFGMLLSASYSDREFTSHNLQGGDPWEEEGDYLIPDEMNLRDYLIRRVRKGAVANFEFRPNDNLRLHWRNLFNRYEDTEFQREVTYDFRNGDLEDQTPTSGTFTEGEGERANTKRYEIQSILSSTLALDYTFGSWEIHAAATYGETEQDTPYDNGFAFELADETPMSYDTSNYFFVVDAGQEFLDAENFEFGEAAIGGQIIEEDLRVGQLDLKRHFELGDNRGFLKLGAKFISRESTSDQDMLVYDGFDGDDDFLLSSVAQQGAGDFYRSERNYYTFGPVPNYSTTLQFFRDNEGDFELSDADTIAESYGVDYRVEEEVTAGYVMGSIALGSATFIGGVRLEKTSTDFEAYDVVFVDGDSPNPPPQVSGSKDYTNWLPDLLMTWAPREDVRIRAAWTNTIGRPSYEQNVPFRVFEIEEDDEDVFEGSIETGNADLDPLESANFDLTGEWYLQPAGLLSAGVFYKDIDNPIFTRLQTLEEVDFEGRFYSELEIVQAQNARSGDILGVELGYQQQFTRLPGVWRGLGVALSYTWTDSEAQTFDREEKVPFFLQSDKVASVALFYELNGFEMRLGYAYRSEYLDALGDAEEQDLYVDEHGQLDFKASYEFSRQFSAFVQMQNITDEPLRYFSGERSRLAENEIYSWNVMAGVSLKF